MVIEQTDVDSAAQKAIDDGKYGAADVTATLRPWSAKTGLCGGTWNVSWRGRRSCWNLS